MNPRRYSRQHIWGILAILGLFWLIISQACAAPAGIPFLAGTATSTSTPIPPTSTPTPIPSPTPLLLLPPVVVEIQPLPGSQISTTSPISLYFDQPMDKASVEAALLGTPQLTGSFIWLDDASLQFSPDQSFEPGTKLSLTLTTDAHSLSGLNLLEPVEASYEIADYLHIVDRLPRSQDLPLDPPSSIVVTFDQPVVSIETEPSNLTPAFSLQPAANGRGEWLNTSTYIFYPDPPLAGGQEYTVTINPRLESILGSPLEPDQADRLIWSFTTNPPQLVAFAPDASQPVGLDATLSLSFNQGMDPASVEQNFTLQDANGGVVPGKFEWNESNTEVEFSPSILLTRSLTYTAVLFGTARSLGGVPLGMDFTSSFVTVADFTFLTAREFISNPFNPGWGTIVLDFNAPLAEQELSELIRFKPAVDHMTITKSGSSASIYGAFAASTLYQITLSADLRDRWEGKLAKQFQAQYHTGPLPAMLSVPALNSGMRAVFLPLGEKILAAQATNLRSVTVTSRALLVQDFIQLFQSTTRVSEAVTTPVEFRWMQTINQVPNRLTNFNLTLVPSGRTLLPGVYFYSTGSDGLPDDYEYPPEFMLVVSRIQLALKYNANQINVWAVDLDTNLPVADLPVSFYDQAGTPLGLAVTDTNGMGTLDGIVLESGYKPFFAVSGKPTEENFSLTVSTWNYQLRSWDFRLNSEFGRATPKLYLYTDRPIYQPGQRIYYRAIAKIEENGRYTSPSTRELNINVYGEYSEITGERPIVTAEKLSLSKFDTAEGSFQLPKDAAPGYYSIAAPDYMKELSFQVAQYRKPEIDIQVNFSASEMLYGSDLEGQVQAVYYFGAPASDIKVHWSLTASPGYFPLPGGYRAGMVDLGWVKSDWEMYGHGNGKFITSGMGETDAQGNLLITVPVEQYKKVINQEESWDVKIEVTVEDESGIPISGRASLRLHPTTFYIGIRPSVWSISAGQELGFDIQTANWQAQPSGNHNLSADFSRIDWKRSDQPDIGGVFQWIPEFIQTGSVDFTADGIGRARLIFIPPEPGMYMLNVQGEDAKSQVLIWVGGKGHASWPQTIDQHINLIADQEQYQAGQTARIFVPNPLGENALAWVTYERGKVMRSEVLTIQEASYELLVPLTEEDAPNLYVSILLMGSRKDGKPDYRMGYVELGVEPVSELLQVELTSQPELGSPAGEVSYTISVSDHAGRPVQAEFSMGLVDKAVLALSDPNALDIRSAFYDHQPLGVYNGLPLAVYASRFIPDYPGIGGGGGGDNLAPALRENFEDTAYWNPAILTDSNGQAHLSVKLPDNLTTWVAVVRGLTSTAQVGSASHELIVTKELLIRPLTPNFLVVGDHVQIGAIVHNNITQEISVEVSIQALGFSFDDPGQTVQQVNIPAGGRQRVDWWGLVQPVDQVEFIFSAQGGGLSDSARPEIGLLPVKRYSAPQTFMTAGVLASASERMEIIALPKAYTPIGGELRLELTPSLSGTILGSLEALETFPHDYPEGIISRLLPNLEVYLTLQTLGLEPPALKERLEEAISDGVHRLESTQNSDGGWGWVNGYISDEYITAYVLYGFSRASQNGVMVDAKVIEKAQAYLAGVVVDVTPNMESYILDRQIFIRYALLNSGYSLNDPVSLYEVRRQLSPWAQSMLALLLDAFSVNDPRAATIISEIQSSAVRSASGAYWEDALHVRQNLSTPNFNTAVALLALAKLDPAAGMIPEVIRYLVSHRSASCSWSSSYESAWILMALTEVMKATADLQPNFGYSASLNGNALVSGQVGGSDAGGTVSSIVPLESLTKEYANDLRIRREEGKGNLYYRAFLRLDRPVESAQPVNRGISIERGYFLAGKDCRKEVCEALNGVQLGEVTMPVVARLTINLSHDAQFLVVEDYIPAGMQIVDFSLKTAQNNQTYDFDLQSPYKSGWGWWYFSAPTIYSDHIRWVAPSLPAGPYVLTYQLQPIQAGDYRVLPAHAYEFYFPEVEGSSSGAIFNILP